MDYNSLKRTSKSSFPRHFLHIFFIHPSFPIPFPSFFLHLLPHYYILPIPFRISLHSILIPLSLLFIYLPSPPSTSLISLPPFRFLLTSAHIYSFLSLPMCSPSYMHLYPHLSSPSHSSLSPSHRLLSFPLPSFRFLLTSHLHLITSHLTFLPSYYTLPSPPPSSFPSHSTSTPSLGFSSSCLLSNPHLHQEKQGLGNVLWRVLPAI